MTKHPFVAAVEAAIAKAKDPGRPTKLFRLTREQHQLFLDRLPPEARAKINDEIELPDGVVLRPGAPGQWMGMRFVIVDGVGDLTSETP